MDARLLEPGTLGLPTEKTLSDRVDTLLKRTVFVTDYRDGAQRLIPTSTRSIWESSLQILREKGFRVVGRLGGSQARSVIWSDAVLDDQDTDLVIELSGGDPAQLRYILPEAVARGAGVLPGGRDIVVRGPKPMRGQPWSLGLRVGTDSETKALDIMLKSEDARTHRHLAEAQSLLLDGWGRVLGIYVEPGEFHSGVSDEEVVRALGTASLTGLIDSSSIGLTTHRLTLLGLRFAKPGVYLGLRIYTELNHLFSLLVDGLKDKAQAALATRIEDWHAGHPDPDLIESLRVLLVTAGHRIGEPVRRMLLDYFMAEGLREIDDARALDLLTAEALDQVLQEHSATSVLGTITCPETRAAALWLASVSPEVVWSSWLAGEVTETSVQRMLECPVLRDWLTGPDSDAFLRKCVASEKVRNFAMAAVSTKAQDLAAQICLSKSVDPALRRDLLEVLVSAENPIVLKALKGQAQSQLQKAFQQPESALPQLMRGRIPPKSVVQKHFLFELLSEFKRRPELSRFFLQALDAWDPTAEPQEIRRWWGALDRMLAEDCDACVLMLARPEVAADPNRARSYLRTVFAHYPDGELHGLLLPMVSVHPVLAALVRDRFATLSRARLKALIDVLEEIRDPAASELRNALVASQLACAETNDFPGWIAYIDQTRPNPSTAIAARSVLLRHQVPPSELIALAERWLDDEIVAIQDVRTAFVERRIAAAQPMLVLELASRRPELFDLVFDLSFSLEQLVAHLAHQVWDERYERLLADAVKIETDSQALVVGRRFLPSIPQPARSTVAEALMRNPVSTTIVEGYFEQVAAYQVSEAEVAARIASRLSNIPHPVFLAEGNEFFRTRRELGRVLQDLQADPSRMASNLTFSDAKAEWDRRQIVVALLIGDSSAAQAGLLRQLVLGSKNVESQRFLERLAASGVPVILDEFNALAEYILGGWPDEGGFELGQQFLPLLPRDSELLEVWRLMDSTNPPTPEQLETMNRQVTSFPGLVARVMISLTDRKLPLEPLAAVSTGILVERAWQDGQYDLAERCTGWLRLFTAGSHSNPEMAPRAVAELKKLVRRRDLPRHVLGPVISTLVELSNWPERQDWVTTAFSDLRRWILAERRDLIPELVFAYLARARGDGESLTIAVQAFVERAPTAGATVSHAPVFTACPNLSKRLLPRACWALSALANGTGRPVSVIEIKIAADALRFAGQQIEYLTPQGSEASGEIRVLLGACAEMLARIERSVEQVAPRSAERLEAASALLHFAPNGECQQTARRIVLHLASSVIPPIWQLRWIPYAFETPEVVERAVMALLVAEAAAGPEGRTVDYSQELLRSCKGCLEACAGPDHLGLVVTALTLALGYEPVVVAATTRAAKLGRPLKIAPGMDDEASTHLAMLVSVTMATIATQVEAEDWLKDGAQLCGWLEIIQQQAQPLAAEEPEALYKELRSANLYEQFSAMEAKIRKAKNVRRGADAQVLQALGDGLAKYRRFLAELHRLAERRSR